MKVVTDAEIAMQRLEAAQAEWERHDRVRRVVVGILESRATGLREAALAIEACVAELRSGDWIRSPQEMAARRAAEQR